MKRLHVFTFNQHWFHLGSAAENIIDKQSEFKNINLYLFQQHLRLLPIDLHFRFPFSHRFKNTPENILARFLENRIGSKFSFSSINLLSQNSRKFPTPATVSQLKSIKIDEMEIGMAIASHIISLTKDSEPKLFRFKMLIQSCFEFYLEAKFWFESQNYSPGIDEIWVCNGRTFHERVIAELAKKSFLEVKYYEIGGEGQVPNRWILHNNSPHSRKLLQNEMAHHYELNRIETYEIDKWFRSHENPKINRFASNNPVRQSDSSMKISPYIVFFSSSDDEVAAISAEWDSPWGTQIKAVEELIDYFSSQERFRLVIRVHPNQGNKSRNDRKNWNRLRQKKNVQIFRYSDRINSYELMNNSVAVLTHGSTMGIEAAYRRKPQAYLAPSRYDLLIPAPLLQSIELVDKWVSDLTVNSKEKSEIPYLGALKWANFMLTAGSTWNFVRVVNHRGRIQGELLGKRLRPNSLIVAVSKIYVFTHRSICERHLEAIKLSLG
jgi:hypothetical protein